MENTTSSITLIGVVLTFVIGLCNLAIQLKGAERTRVYSEYEKRKDKFLLLCAEFFEKYKFENVMVRTQSHDEIWEKNQKAQEYLHEFKCVCHQIILTLRESNPYSSKIDELITKSLKLFGDAHFSSLNATFAHTALEEGRIPETEKIYNIDGEHIVMSPKKFIETGKEMTTKGIQDIMRQFGEFESMKDDILLKLKAYLAFEDNLALDNSHILARNFEVYYPTFRKWFLRILTTFKAKIF
ncbi:hypothetical protein tpqmel_0328 [Candidatus Gastranaerophilus sp. (ex Termes propinquus)]|nr:hypothetical protein tpqmel_0328 [Candidatus Gastranaerophilus sp. (ex Termes propinquus)]